MVKNPPVNVRDVSLMPDLGRPHMLQSYYAPVPQLLRACAPEPGGRSCGAHVPGALLRSEKPEHCNEKESLFTRTREEPARQ